MDQGASPGADENVDEERRNNFLVQKPAPKKPTCLSPSWTTSLPKAWTEAEVYNWASRSNSGLQSLHKTFFDRHRKQKKFCDSAHHKMQDDSARREELSK
jgi:hypothetical protein